MDSLLSWEQLFTNIIEYRVNIPITQLALLIGGFYFLKSYLTRSPFEPRRKIVPPNASVAITGCDTGFGRMTCEQLAKKGYLVFAGCYTEEGIKALDELYLPNLKPFKVDVTNSEQIYGFAEFIQKESPQGLFALVNNAGVLGGSLFDWTPVETFRQVVEVNLFSVVTVTKAMIPLLKKSKGRIINVSSLAGVLPSATSSAYSTSKHGIMGFSKAIRGELDEFGIDVVIIAPSFMKTNLLTTCRTPHARAWDQLPEWKKQEYGPKFFEDFQKMSDTMISTGGDPQTVVDAMIDGVTSPKPKEIYQIGMGADFMVNFPAVAEWISKFTRPKVQGVN